MRSRLPLRTSDFVRLGRGVMEGQVADALSGASTGRIGLGAVVLSSLPRMLH